MIDLSKDKFFVKDDVLEDETLAELEKRMLNDDDFPWFLASYGTVLKPGQPVDSQYKIFGYEKMYEDVQFFHVFVGRGKPCSPFVNIVEPIMEELGIKEAFRIKANLQLKSDKVIEGGYNTPHCDVPTAQDWMKICVLHLNNSDGDTVLFDDKKNEMERIPFKRGRAIYMRHNIFHSGNHPKDHRFRLVMNFNFK